MGLWMAQNTLNTLGVPATWLTACLPAYWAGGVEKWAAHSAVNNFILYLIYTQTVAELYGRSVDGDWHLAIKACICMLYAPRWHRESPFKTVCRQFNVKYLQFDTIQLARSWMMCQFVWVTCTGRWHIVARRRAFSVLTLKNNKMCCCCCR